MSTLSGTPADGRPKPSTAPHANTAPQSSGAETESEADELEMSSPEGRPADPGVRGKTTVALIAIAVAVVVVAAGLIARAGNPWLAAGIALAGLIFVIVFNPIVWTSVLRVREREKVHDEREHAAGRS